MLMPAPDCTLCPRLASFRADARARFPGWHNAPVAAFGDLNAEVLIVGLAPGLKGANRTGRPFTGDHAGELLYQTLIKLGLAAGDYGRARDDGLRLERCRITNAVRCVPPANRPTPEEVRTCGHFLAAEIAALPRLHTLVALGTVAHGACLAALGLPASAWRFSHGARHLLPDGRRLIDSYHCSRQNTNTGRLTAAMFEAALAQVLQP
ncbi:Type-5 uracil-DNA glycosylase [Candidatus Defluviicoccus seviourii]|uniref:Type-5 uracil-DNA glycosylase n=1 Tax=Candidatus Defluviicoccus seviourii TaxID=2565273 RepID=A0A564WH47_9PROT|nr:Type-5 uracil-DNA glycosylase [Candidatus Defluviicoccus seviourii]